jgi:ferric-dicitrate binding protein FerR (iron transport regulator)
MHTNTAVISARGTEWIAEAQRAATAVVALDGEVAVQNVDPAVPGQVTLGPGEGVTVEAGAPPPAPTVWGDARRNAFIERTTVP